jgi:uncharacterized iron-regulated membrane protein
MKFSTALVKQSLSGHSWLGLFVGTLMYIVCLTGTLSVFYPEFQRWEQANVEESFNYDIVALEGTFNDLISDESVVTEHMYLNLPTSDMPRTTIATEGEEWFTNTDGSIGASVNHNWTELLVGLHLYLTIPNSLGVVLVSALGAMLCALIVSGFLAHPRILKDAFKLRMDGNSRLEQVDIHNRFSVWAAPFHMLIAITGAYFGLVLPMLAAISAFTGEDAAAIQAVVFGEEPALHQEGGFQIVRAFENLALEAPEATPFRLIVHNAGEPEQFLEILASHPQRMIYSENYRFDTEGSYLGKTGFSDGQAGQQIIYSMYYLHFGHFAGYVSKIVYLLLGLALTVVSVTGINIWLKKRSYEDQLNELWVGCVWGIPLALLISALTQVTLGIVSTPIFWLSFVCILVYCLIQADERMCRRRLLQTTAIFTSLLLTAHISKFGLHTISGASPIINSGLMVYLGYCFWLVRNSRQISNKNEPLPDGASSTT